MHLQLAGDCLLQASQEAVVPGPEGDVARKDFGSEVDNAFRQTDL